MTLHEAKKTAKELLGIDTPFSYRNVWVFFAPTDSGKSDLIITKDDAEVRHAGMFFDDPDSNMLIDIATGASIAPEDVFGKPFFADDASLTEDTVTAVHLSLQERIDTLLEQIAHLLKNASFSPVAMFMVCDLLEDCEKTSYQRLVVLYNYLSRHAADITLEEFSYLHHELYTLG